MLDPLECNALFSRYFERWYPEQWVQLRGRPQLLPDIINRSELARRSPHELSPLPKEVDSEVRQQIVGMLRAAEQEWPGIISVRKPVDEHWVNAFDKAWPAEALPALISNSKPEVLSNPYVVLCCEFGAVMGHVLQTKKPRLIWLPNFLYWDSELFDPQSGISIPVFHWAIKKMSNYGVNDGFVAKINMCVQLLEQYDGGK